MVLPWWGCCALLRLWPKDLAAAIESSCSQTLIEIKPASQRALGLRQADAYKAGLETMFSKLGVKMFDERGMGYFKQCMSTDGKFLELTRDVDPYDFCEGMTPEKLEVVVPVPDVASEATE